MMKRDELCTNTSCFNKAASDEPIFVLRGKDPLAAQTVRLWATMAEGKHEAEKIAEALRLAELMDEWNRQKKASTIIEVGGSGSISNNGGGASPGVKIR